jgi:hypothetical protein
MGSYIGSQQAFLYTFTETTASTYQHSAELDGIPGFQLSSTRPTVTVLPATVNAWYSSMDWSEDSDSENTTAGSVASLELIGRDVYGALY